MPRKGRHSTRYGFLVQQIGANANRYKRFGLPNGMNTGALLAVYLLLTLNIKNTLKYF